MENLTGYGSLIIAAVTLVMNALVIAVGGTWALSRMELRLGEKIEKHRDEVDENAAKATHDFGETIAALKEKIVQVELWTRDHLVRRDSFTTVIDSLGKQIESLTHRLEQRLSRMEDKIDRARSSDPSRG